MCLSDCVIGVRGSCGCDNPESNLWLDDLGLSIKSGDKIADGVSAQEGEELIKQSVSFAWEKLKKDFLAILDTKYQFNNIISNVKIVRAGSTSTGADDYSIEILNHAYYDQFSVITVDRIGFYSFDAVIGGSIEVHEDGVVRSIATNIVVGMNYVDLGIKSKAQTIKIVFPVGMQIGRNSIATSLTNCASCITNCGENCFSIYGKDGVNSTDVFADLNITCGCDEDVFICNVKKELYLPLLYMTGITVIHKAQASDRIDYWITNSKDWFERKLLEWNGGTDRVSGIFQKGEYWEQLKGAGKRVEKYLSNLDCRCFKRNGAQIVSELQLPNKIRKSWDVADQVNQVR